MNQTGSMADVLARAAERSGIDASGAVSIRNGSNAIYELPGGVVARIGKPGTAATAEREIHVSQWLNESGIATVEAVPSVPQPVVIDDRPVTWWRLIPKHRASTPEELGSMLRTLHALPPPAAFELPIYDPFAGLRERIASATTVTEDDRSWLLEHFVTLKKQYDELPDPQSPCVIHGDAWQGNLVVPPSGVPTLLDLDKVSIGRREWDLIQLGVDFTDFSRISENEYRSFVAAYGRYDVTDWPGFRVLADIQELRWVGFALSLTGTNGSAAEQARHRIACLRGEVARPWRWEAL
jgi:aminoglycoside phosphotransferase (APT) family kinase protein